MSSLLGYESAARISRKADKPDLQTGVEFEDSRPC